MHNYRLTPQEREAYRNLEHLEISVPDRIAQYLKGIGNFTTNGELFEVTWPDFDFSADAGIANVLRLGGFYNTAAGRRVNATTMWLYAHVPVPGVLMSTIVNEYVRQSGGNVTLDLDRVRPVIGNVPGATQVTASENILFHEVQAIDQLHSSWEDTLYRLGYRDPTAAQRLDPPNGTISQWLVHPESLRWTSDVLTAIGGVKTSRLQDVLKSKTGVYFQVAYIEQPEYLLHQEATPQLRPAFKATADLSMVLSSFNPINPTHLGPALGCGYRYWIRFGTINNVAGVSPSPPWFFTTANVLTPLPLASRVAANAWFARLPAEYAVRAYQTGHVERRTLLHNILQ